MGVQLGWQGHPKQCILPMVTLHMAMTQTMVSVAFMLQCQLSCHVASKDHVAFLPQIANPSRPDIYIAVISLYHCIAGFFWYVINLPRHLKNSVSAHITAACCGTLHLEETGL